MSESPFGEVIHTYTRAQAIEDGFLVDVTQPAREAGFRVPVAVTSALYELVNDTRAAGQSVEGRLWDVLWLLMWAIKAEDNTTSPLFYKVSFRTKHPTEDYEQDLAKTLKAVSGPGDQGEHVITIMLDHED